jgi:bifunctional DNA-binding transcriptional regulator/antitoxin component of YhaV-PrlF toxin-antitoxin module
MAYESTVQVIQRGGKNRQGYLICPAPLAQALEIAKGEGIEWMVEDKYTLVLKRTPQRTDSSPTRRRRHE